VINLAKLQDQFQKAVLDGDDTILSSLSQGAFADRRDTLNVYRTYYKARLVGVLKNNFPLLHAYLGTGAFDALADAYITCCPSRHQNARVYARELSQFIAKSEPYKRALDVCELSRIELAVIDAFDAVEADCLSAQELRTVLESRRPGLALTAHPSVTFLSLTGNTFAIWRALSGGGEVPRPMILKEVENLFVWRRDTKPFVRSASAEEARFWATMAGRSFFKDHPCVGQEDTPEADFQGRVGVYLGRWVEDGMLSTAAERASAGIPTP